MMKKLVLVVAFSGLTALVLASVLSATGVGHAGVGDIFGTEHNVGTGETPTCMICHIPHEAYGDYLWFSTPVTYPGWEGSKILPLCFSCHDGSETNRGLYIVDEPDLDNHPMALGEDISGDCMTCREPDCGRCHDPHSNAWVFLDAERFTSELQNADLCLQCHTGSHHGIGDSHPQGNASLPVSADDDWDGNTDDFVGTPLWDADGREETGSTGDVRCMTCHRPHGAQYALMAKWKWSSRNNAWSLDEELHTLNSMAISDEVTEDGKTYYRSPICVNCHE